MPESHVLQKNVVVNYQISRADNWILMAIKRLEKLIEVMKLWLKNGQKNKMRRYNTISDYMTARGYTQVDAAISIGISQCYLSMIITGKRSPGKKTLIKLQVAGIRIEKFLTGEK